MRATKRSRLLFAPFLLAIVAGGAGPVWAGQAAPERIASTPAANEQRTDVPPEVNVTFSTPLDASSTLKVVTECGVRVDDGKVEVVASRISVGISSEHQELEDPAIGEYEVQYQAKSTGGVAGETRSTFTFHAPLVCEEDHNGHVGKGRCNQHKSNKKHCKHGKGKKKHDKHDKHDKDGKGHDDGKHDEDDDGSHSGGSSDHDSGSSDHDSSGTDHAARDHKGKSDGKHKEHNEGGSPDLVAAGGPGGPATPISADAQAAVIGLGLALLVGVMGGWFLRIGPR